MNKAELQVRVEIFERELKQLRSIKVGCQSCVHYARSVCAKWEVAPPPDIVQQGCEEWTYDFVPF